MSLSRLSWSRPAGCGKALEKNEEGKEEIKEEAKEESVLFPEPGAIPGGIADLSGKTGFLVNPGGGIDAVDLETGKVLWHSDAASYPLVIHDDRLYAQEKTDVNPLRVVALNIAAKGKRVMISDPIELLAPPPPKDDLRKDRPSRMVLPDHFASFARDACAAASSTSSGTRPAWTRPWWTPRRGR
ncbi:MAG: hypothetical protein U0793_19815 [Gemmataceae bacterium]